MPDPGLGDDFSRMAFGTGSPAEMADQPSGLGQVAGGMYTGLGELAKQMFGESENLRAGRGYNAGPAVQTTLGAMGGPLVAGTKAAGEAVLGSGPIIRSAAPIKAYHSSPHDFDQFKDVGKIGEGARVITEGGYFAENPAVSGQGGQYWNQFLRKFVPDEKEAARVLQTTQFDRDAAAAKLAQFIEDARAAQGAPTAWNQSIDFAKRTQDYERQLELLKSGGPVGPRTYEVGIHADPNEMLKWDQTLDKQPHILERMDPDVRMGMDDLLNERGFNPITDAPEGYTGKDLYKALKHHEVQEYLPDVLPGSSWITGDTTAAKHATAYLEHLDIPGVKYLDERSRGPMGNLISDLPDGGWLFKGRRYYDRNELMQDVSEAKAAHDAGRTYNYVVHPNSLDKVEIFKKYGIGSDAGLGNAFAASMMSRHPEQFAPPQAPVTRENLT